MLLRASLAMKVIGFWEPGSAAGNVSTTSIIDRPVNPSFLTLTAMSIRSPSNAADGNDREAITPSSEYRGSTWARIRIAASRANIP